MNYKLKKAINGGGLSEVFQNKKFRFAYVHLEGKEITMLHKLVKCKDFLNDALIEHHHPGKFLFPVFGFDATGIKLDEPTHLLIESEEGWKNIEKALPALHDLERKMQWKRTQLFPIEDHPNKRLLIGSKQWQRSTIVLSIYTILLRSLVYGVEEGDINKYLKSFKGLEGNDPKFLNKLQSYKGGLMGLITNIKKILGEDQILGGGDPHKIMNGGFHNSSGVMNFMDCCHNDRKLPTWSGGYWEKEYKKILEEM